MADELDVRMETVVTSIHRSPELVEVVARNEIFAAGWVVLAVPLPVLRRLVFDPDLPGELPERLGGLEMGSGAKVAVATNGDPGIFRRQDTDIPAWYWTGLGDDGGVRRAVTGFAGTREGVRALIADPGGRLAASAPGADLEGTPLVADWDSDVFAGGCYSVIGPGQRAGLDVLSRPVGRVVLAGEHVNGSGTLEGAIRSGDAAARVILETAL